MNYKSCKTWKHWCNRFLKTERFVIHKKLVQHKVILKWHYEMIFLITFVNIWGAFSEAVVGRCSVKKVFLKISQNSQENTCARKRLRPATLLKKRTWHRCFPVNFVKFLITSFYRTPFVAASAFFQQRKAQLIWVKLGIQLLAYFSESS